MKQVDVAIIGLGTAGLAAAKEVSKVTSNFIIISNGVYGTTCVRAGCMPAKTFIHGAQLFHSRKNMQRSGIRGAEALNIQIPALLQHVREMRQHFLEHTLKTTEQYRDHIIEGEVWFLSPTHLRVNNGEFETKSVVITTGSTPIIPPACHVHSGSIYTSDTLFEQQDLPVSLGVLGLSVLGTEMAQAFARLGINVTASHEESLIGGLSDPEVNAYAIRALQQEMDIRLNQTPEDCLKDQVEQDIFIALSRQANLNNMGLEAFGICKKDTPVLNHDPHTMQVGDLPIFIAGDVKLGRSILNEAVDEGHIAGYNAVHTSPKSFERRTPLQITHTYPTIAVAGKAWEELDPNSINIGKAIYDDQGRAKIMGEAEGMVRIYADHHTDQLLGAELFAPGGEHLAHLLAWMIARRTTVAEALQLPFYHPSLEEGLLTALKSIR